MASRKLTGIVMSKTEKTIKVEIKRKVKNLQYFKIISKKRNILAHDERGIAGIGEIVEIAEFRPISKNKSWKLNKVL